MAVNWTKEQESVINLRDRNILVSAAAGSGKTAVLVERIITRILNDGINIDELLIVTFTEAAAAEMKERILLAVEKKLKETPENEHLQRQTSLVHNANIMTTHSFCLSVIKSYFYKIDLDPVFRTGDESELNLLKKELLEDLLENKYKDKEASFLNFVETYATGKSDAAIMDIILSLYNYSRSTPQPTKWLEECLNKYECENDDDFLKSDIVQEMFNDIYNTLHSVKTLLNQGVDLCKNDDKMSIYQRFFEKDLEAIDHIINSDKEAIEALIKTFKWCTLRLSEEEKASLDPDTDKMIKKYRDKIKKIFNDNIKIRYFVRTIEEQLVFMKKNHIVMKELVSLVKSFETMYNQRKRALHIIDYSDMEQFALRILNDEIDGNLVPSEIANEYQNKFKEIMVDEYQDSNLVQEAIITSVSGLSKGIYNIFMVGDVKQSIYSFRLSRPELFIDKFDTYDLVDGKCQRIDLHKNFRSRNEVLAGTNHIFYKIMSADLGEINYDEKSALYVGANFPESINNELELRLIDLNTDEYKMKLGESIKKNNDLLNASKLELEAVDVALRIKELMNTHQVIDKKTGNYRSLEYNDIVILTRSKKNWSDTFAAALEQANIPIESESTAGYYDCWEITVLLNYLTVIDNPKQDIPLAGVLTSVFGKLSSEELAVIKVKYPKWKFSDAVMNYAQIDEDIDYPELHRKVRVCMEKIDKYRDINTYASTYELLWKIVEESGYKHYVQAMKMGEQRLANVELLLQQSMQYQKTSFKGLFNFVRYVEQLKKNKVEVGQAPRTDGESNAVKIMTIHKSKGLEFPIVFLVGAGKQFNESDNKEAVIIHPSLGLGVDYVDYKSRIKHKTIAKSVIASKKKLDNKGEELRVLYVAMTRAKEKLIITGALKDFDKKLQEISMITSKKEVFLNYYQRSNAITYLDWILPSTYYLEEFDVIKKDIGLKVDITHSDRKLDIPFQVSRITLEQLVERQIKNIDDKVEESINLGYELQINAENSEETSTNILDRLSYIYPYENESKYKIKVTVTELKENEAKKQNNTQLESSENTDCTPKKKYTQSEKIVPDFMKSKDKDINVATERGNAFHRFLEIWDYTTQGSRSNIEKFIIEQVDKRRLNKEYQQYIDIDAIEKFLNGDLAKRMSNACVKGKLYKEQPFVMGLTAREVYGDDSDETIILQGIIDVYFEEDGEITILDYKTDRINDINELGSRYEMQLNLYAKAVEQLTGNTVKEKIIYSFAKETALVI